MSMPYKVISILILIALLSARASAQTPVEVSPAVGDAFAASQWAPGTVVSRNDARIAAEAEGRVVWIAEAGDTVAAGEPLVRIDDSALQLELDNHAARIGALEAERDFARSQYERLQRLEASQNVSSTQLDEAESQMRMTQQELAQARVAQRQTERRLALSTVIAPFAGQVVERMANVGEYAAPGAVMLRLVDTESREIRVRAPLAVAEYVSPGMRVVVRNDRFVADAEIRTVIPVGDERSRLFELRLQASDQRWVIGSAVRVALPLSEPSERVAVPRDAVIMRGDEMYVFVVAADNTAQRVDVRTGIGRGEQVEVIGDINPGDRLIIRGAERIEPGQSVTVQTRAAQPG
ncbi:MAG: efflux RND transporter periplasmic adaptor subunit [Wenzhouxiangellaceae bacterium]